MAFFNSSTVVHPCIRSKNASLLLRKFSICEASWWISWNYGPNFLFFFWTGSTSEVLSIVATVFRKEGRLNTKLNKASLLPHFLLQISIHPSFHWATSFKVTLALMLYCKCSANYCSFSLLFRVTNEWETFPIKNLNQAECHDCEMKVRLLRKYWSRWEKSPGRNAVPCGERRAISSHSTPVFTRHAATFEGKQMKTRQPLSRSLSKVLGRFAAPRAV